MSDDRQTSSYLDSLPAIYREEALGALPDFLGRFLLAFERVLTGLGDVDHPGFEEILEGIVDAGGKTVLAGAERYFDPGRGLPDGERAPSEFLEWLSGWVALTLRDDWTDEERRRILAEIIPSYQRRGTREGLRQVLAAFSGQYVGSIEIQEFERPFWVGPINGVWTPVGGDAAIGGGPPHYFLVQAQLAAPDGADLERKRKIFRDIIDVEKPAHTYYDLEVEVPTMRLGPFGDLDTHATVGVDTLLGKPIVKPAGSQ